MPRSPVWLAASLLFGAGTLGGAARSGESATSLKLLRPYVHEGEWETTAIVEAPGTLREKSQERQIQRDCLTIAKAESLLKQCRGDEGCGGRQCLQKVAIHGPHSARIQVACATARGEAIGAFNYRWDSWEGTVQIIRDGRVLMSTRMSGRRVGDCALPIR